MGGNVMPPVIRGNLVPSNAVTAIQRSQSQPSGLAQVSSPPPQAQAVLRLRDQEEAADVQASLWKSYHHLRPPHTHTRTKGESESEQMKYHRFAVFYVRQTQ